MRPWPLGVLRAGSGCTEVGVAECELGVEQVEGRCA